LIIAALESRWMFDGHDPYDDHWLTIGSATFLWFAPLLLPFRFLVRRLVEILIDRDRRPPLPRARAGSKR
jgi:hypothetical protein